MNIPDPDAHILVKIHFIAMCVWAILLIPTLLWWSDSILWVCTMSLYANFAAHFSGWDGARGEQKQEES